MYVHLTDLTYPMYLSCQLLRCDNGISCILGVWQLLLLVGPYLREHRFGSIIIVSFSYSVYGLTWSTAI